MHRIDGAGATVDNLFTEGNPQTGTPATVVTDDWLNDIQENLAAVVEELEPLEKGDYTQLLRAIISLIDGAIPGIQPPQLPVGGIVYIADLDLINIDYFLPCDGAAISRAAYPELFAVIGTRFGVGNGTTTFNVPDLRGEFIRGFDGGRGVDSGRVFGSSQADELRSHRHQIDDSASEGTSELTQAFGNAGDAADAYSSYTLNTGGSETRPRNVAMHAIIRHGVLSW